MTMEHKRDIDDGARLRWGILGTAQIAHKNWKAILNSGNGIVRAVASRGVERARGFIQECQRAAPFETPPEAFGSYEELLASREIDAVYVPLPTALRPEWVIRAAEAGKHVVCEKPCARDAAELREMLEACRRNHVQFLDGVMFMHSRRLERVREVIDDGASIGAVRRIALQFSFYAGDDFLRDNIRMNSTLEPQGCLGDLGWYCIRFILWTLKWRLPREAVGRILAQAGGAGSPTPVPTAFSAELLFDEGVSAGFYCSFLAENQQWANVGGTRGYLQVPDFVLPFQGGEIGFEVYNSAFEVRGCDFEMRPNRRWISVAEHSHSHPTTQEANLFRNFAGRVRSGKLSTEWPEWALKTQQVMDACLDSARGAGGSA
jgi:predicted dehydrogenase